MKKLKTSRAITYRRYGIPALILEGKWLAEKYKLQIGDVVDIEYQPKTILFRKNRALSAERQKFLAESAELRRKRMYENAETSANEGIGPGGPGSDQR